ncbi:carboxylase [Candidatus Fermentibacteria bacterium]|nr:carboxylase [Candidatus Fermentibacteria bacterium]
MTLQNRGAVEFVDLSLRDGQQSLLATRMSTDQILDVMPHILDTGVKTMEVWGGATLDSAMRFLYENPFDRLHRMSELARPYGCGLRTLSRGQNLFGYDPYPDDIVSDFNRAAVEAGTTVMRIFDALNYIPNYMAALEGVRKAGGIFEGAVCYSTGKPYNTEYFVSKALELEAAGADLIADKDMAGLKDPVSAWALYTALKARLKVPVVSHTHCTPGYGHICALVAMLAGVDKIDTCFLPFAGGSSHPSIEIMSLFAEILGLDTGLDLSPARLEPVHAKLAKTVAECEEKFSLPKVHRSIWPGRDALAPLAESTLDALAAGRIDSALESVHRMEELCGFPPPNEAVRKSQIPGGMYSNFKNQLAKDGKSEYMERALEAVREVREMAGWVPLVTPTSQIVGVKAYFVALGKEADPIQYINLIAGRYGETPFPIDPEYRLRVCGHREERRYDPSGFDRSIPALPGTDFKIAESEQERLLYYLFPDSSGKAYLEKLTKERYGDRIAEEEARREKARLEKMQRMRDEAVLNRFSDSMGALSERLSEAMSILSTDEDPSTNALIKEAAEYTDI